MYVCTLFGPDTPVLVVMCDVGFPKDFLVQSDGWHPPFPGRRSMEQLVRAEANAAYVQLRRTAGAGSGKLWRNGMAGGAAATAFPSVPTWW